MDRMRRLLIASTCCALAAPIALLALSAQQQPPAPQRAKGDSARNGKPPRDTLTRAQRQAVREVVRDARTMTRQRMGGDSATRAALTAAASGSAFASPEARTVVDKARESRERQDNALKAYRATTTQRISASMGARRLGLEKLLFRGDNVAEISWRREVGVRVRPIGSRMTVPMASETSGDFVSAVTVPYFPGREQLWFPSSNFGVVKTDVDEREMIHPLARGAERFYRYETGDSADITLPDGRVIHLRELHITARKPDWRTFVGSFWFDRDGGQLVRAAYRMATDIDIWSIANDEIEKDIAENKQLGPVRDSLLRARLPRELYVKDSVGRARVATARGANGEEDKPPAWVTATMRPMKASLDAITVEYALYKGKFWLPRAHSATANADVMFMRVPFRFDEKFSYEDVDGDFALAPLPPARNRFEAGPGRDSTDVDLDNGVEVSVSAGGKRRTPPDSAQRDSLERRRYGPGKVTQCRTDSTWTKVEERHDRALRIAYDMPCDMERLRTSPALPAATTADEELFDVKSQEQLIEALGMSLQTPWAPQLPKVRVGSDLFRYNRVEGLSAGVEVSQALGAGYTLTGVGRIGHADWHANGELALARSNGLRTVTGTVYHRLAASNPEWAGALSLGPSLPALLYGRDEGFYYRTMGASLGEHREQRRGSLEYSLFSERQWTAGDTDVVNTFSFARAFSDRRFNVNIGAEPSTFTGATVTWARTLLDQPNAWRLVSVARAEAATGTFQYARASLEQTVSRPLGRRVQAAFTGAAGSSAGRLPVQRAWSLGGLRTVRGQLPGTQSGNAFWYGRAELGTRQGAARPVVFYDAGWAGTRKAFGNGLIQRGAGFGLGLLDGLFRIDVARGIAPSRRWRTDLYIGAPL
jgi:Spy/CpxP family protein refolding chaperone